MTLHKTIRLAAALILAAPLAVRADGKPTLKVITASQPGFWVDSTLIAGSKDAVLIDAQFTLSDAHRLAAEILESGKNLTTIYVTHFHPDHYFGLVVLKQAFPNAKIVAQPATVKEIQDTWREKVAQWGPMYGANLSTAPIVPDALEGNALTLEGETFTVTAGVQGDSADNSYVWVPSLKAVVCGDIVYNGVFPWTKETTPAQRKKWIKTLDAIAKLDPAVVVAGHKNPALPDDPSSLVFMKGYLAAYDKALASSKTEEEFMGKVKAAYPALSMDIILKLAADAAFPAKK